MFSLKMTYCTRNMLLCDDVTNYFNNNRSVLTVFSTVYCSNFIVTTVMSSLRFCHTGEHPFDYMTLLHVLAFTLLVSKSS
jgi:hypothetical protein